MGQPSGRRRTRGQVPAEPPALQSCVVGLVIVALSARLRPPRSPGVHPTEAWSQRVVALKSLCLAVVTAFAGAWWSDGTLDTVTRKLIDRSAWLVVRRRVRGHRSRLPVVRPCARSSSCRAACSIGFLMALSQSEGRCETQPASYWVSPWRLKDVH